MNYHEVYAGPGVILCLLLGGGGGGGLRVVVMGNKWEGHFVVEHFFIGII